MTVYPSTCLPYQSKLLVDAIDPLVMVTSPDGLSKFTILGGPMPFPGVPGQDGVICTEWPTGLDADEQFKHLDQAGANQDGVTWTGTVYDPQIINLPMEAHAFTPEGLSRTVAEFKSVFDPKVPFTMEYLTLDRGYWYTNPRLMPVRGARAPKISPRRILRQDVSRQVRVDDTFWKSIPSTTTYAPGSGTHTGPMSFVNIGTEGGWPGYLVYAGTGSNKPTFSFSNGIGSTSLITFGPLQPGQVVLITTLPRLRSVVDLTQVDVSQVLTDGQKFLEQLLDLVTNNNIPPLLQQFESLFGINPPQGTLYSLLNGRWDDNSSIPGVRIPEQATVQQITVGITNGNTDSRIIGSITPMRRWPE